MIDTRKCINHRDNSTMPKIQMTRKRLSLHLLCTPCGRQEGYSTAVLIYKVLVITFGQESNSIPTVLAPKRMHSPSSDELVKYLWSTGS